MIPANLKLIAYVLVSTLLFATGYSVRGAYDSKQKLAIEQAKAEFVQMYRDSEQKQANTLQLKLDELKANERVINHEITKVIQNNIYRNECLDTPGVQLIERARTGKADTSEPSSEMPTTD